MRVLISSPEFDTITRYLHAWSKRFAAKAEKNHKVIHIEGEKVTKKHVCGILKKKSIDLVMINGHGADDCIAGQNNEILFDSVMFLCCLAK